MQGSGASRNRLRSPVCQGLDPASQKSTGTQKSRTAQSSKVPGKAQILPSRAILVGAALWHRRSNREEYRVSSGVVSNQPQGSIKWIYRSLAGWSWTRADTTDSLANVITCGFHADPLDCSPRVQSMEPPTAAVSTASDEHPACTSGITFSCRVFQIHSSKAEPAEVHGFFFSCLFSGFLLDFPWRPRSICHERYSALQR